MEWITRAADKTAALGSVVSAAGPTMVLAAMLQFFGQWWTEGLLYLGLASMVGVSLWDLLSPANKRCGADGCPSPQVRA